MTTLRSNIVSPVNIRQLLIKVKQDLVGHPKLGLPSKYEGEGYMGLLQTVKDKKFNL